MKKNILKSLIKDQGFVLLNDWQENNLKGGNANVDNCSCESLGNNCTCNGNNCDCPPKPQNNCTCGDSNGNPKCADNCNCYTTQAPPPSVSEGPTKLENTSMTSFWPGLI